MSNNLVSQQLSVPSNQMGQLEPIPNKMDATIRMGLMGPATNDPASQMMSISNMQMGLSETLSNFSGSPKVPLANLQTGKMGPMANNMESQHFFMPNKQLGETGTMVSHVGPPQLAPPNKRKAPAEPMPNSPISQQLSMPNKRVAQKEHRPWLQQIYVPNEPNRKIVQIQSSSSIPGSQYFPAPNKRTVHMESIPSKTGLKQVKNRTTQVQSSPRGQTESFESVRSKMRESLDAALALVSQEQDKPLDVEKNSRSEVENTTQSQENMLPEVSPTATADAVVHVSEESKNILSSVEDCSGQKHKVGQSASEEIFSNKNTGNGQEFQYSTFLPEEVSFSDDFFVKDELLQGNGLSWVLDPGTVVADNKEIQTAEKHKLDQEKLGGDWAEQQVQSTQILASKIEAELFKLYGGVNKKYKEKGRSLLFNLKDRNNPELRERVRSGEIPPERLCSMTAEELASRELSQWRIAKAEELAQMVVLPDSEVDIRRLVRKTHKGEFQVEFEQDDTVSVEVSAGTSSLSQIPSKTEEKTEAPPGSKPDKTKGKVRAASEKSKLEDRDIDCTLSIPSTDGTDLMQGLMVDDALKDPEFLPPIVSLDEFMESLDSEPPFENLPVDAGKMTPISEKDDSEVGSESKSSGHISKDPIDTRSNKPEKTLERHTKSDTEFKSSEKSDSAVKATASSNVKSETTAPVGTSMGEHIWEGLIQLNITATASVVGFFKSGEKMSAKDWPSILEIKGRVKLDAFEKFIQALRMSRSRGVMVVHFVWKAGSSESKNASLREVADSYVMDERVGIAEPAPGVELYCCPPHATTLDVLSKILQKDQIQELNTVDNGLIGVIIWRKAQLTSIVSPKSSSHHKHGSKKQHHTSRRQQENVMNMNANHPTNPKPSHHDDEDDDDDVPPGFGPGTGRDEDDLPEFNFSSSSNPSLPKLATQNNPLGPRMAPFNPLSHTSSHPPVDQLRELVNKYGQTQTRGFGVPNKSWKDDDDDDIPEWQPQVPQQPVHSFQQPLLRPHMMNHQHLGSAPPQQPTHQPIMPLQGSQNAWWVPPSQGNVLAQTNVGQFYGASGQQNMDWRKDAPKSRGF